MKWYDWKRYGVLGLALTFVVVLGPAALTPELLPGTAAILHAQELNGGSPSAGTPDGGSPAAGQSPEQRKAAEQATIQQLRAKIEALKYDKLKQALAMDDETAKKFFEVYRPAEKDIQDIVKERNEELKKLGLMMNGAKSDADVDPAMQKLRELNQKIEDRTQRLDSDLKPVLSPRQRAKLLVFEHEFNQRVREEVVKQRLANKAQASKAQRQELKNALKQMHQQQQALKHQAQQQKKGKR